MDSESQVAKYELAYECGLEEAIEARKRLYNYSETRVYALRVSMILWAVVCLVLSLSMTDEQSSLVRLMFAMLACVIGAGFGYLYKKGIIKSHFESTTKRELKGKLPYKVRYKVTDQEIEAQSLNIKYTFPLESLEEIKIDEQWLEAKFESGLCLLPLSTFKNDEERERFIAALKQEI